MSNWNEFLGRNNPVSNHVNEGTPLISDDDYISKETLSLLVEEVLKKSAHLLPDDETTISQTRDFLRRLAGDDDLPNVKDILLAYRMKALQDELGANGAIVSNASTLMEAKSYALASLAIALTDIRGKFGNELTACLREQKFEMPAKMGRLL